MTRTVLMSLLALLASGPLSAQPNPTVFMNVTLPDGQVTEATAPESGLALVTTKDGTSIGIRPTIVDSRPWSRIVLTFFRMPTATTGAEELGSVEARTGGAAVEAKITPALKVAVSRVTAPAQPASTH